MSMLQEFRAFAMRGNVVDMAVGVIIGASFGKIVSSLVNDVIMPPLGMVTGKVDFSELALVLKEKTAETDAISIRYGVLINNIVDFLIVAFVIFLVIKQMNRLANTKQPAEASPTTKDCPFCLSTVPRKATRCPHCTSEMSAV